MSMTKVNLYSAFS